MTTVAALLLIYCTGAANGGCHVHADRTWTGPNAAAHCAADAEQLRAAGFEAWCETYNEETGE